MAGTVVLVAANGDQLHTMYSGILNVNGNDVADYVFFGGSGRFFGAGGTGQIFASFDVSNGFQNVPRTRLRRHLHATRWASGDGSRRLPRVATPAGALWQDPTYFAAAGSITSRPAGANQQPSEGLWPPWRPKTLAFFQVPTGNQISYP